MILHQMKRRSYSCLINNVFRVSYRLGRRAASVRELDEDFDLNLVMALGSLRNFCGQEIHAQIAQPCHASAGSCNEQQLQMTLPLKY